MISGTESNAIRKKSVDKRFVTRLTRSITFCARRMATKIRKMAVAKGHASDIKRPTNLLIVVVLDAGRPVADSELFMQLNLVVYIHYVILYMYPT